MSESCSQPGMLQYSSILMVSEFCSESSFLVMCTIPGTLSLAHTHGWWKVIGVIFWMCRYPPCLPDVFFCDCIVCSAVVPSQVILGDVFLLAGSEQQPSAHMAPSQDVHINSETTQLVLSQVRLSVCCITYSQYCLLHCILNLSIILHTVHTVRYCI